MKLSRGARACLAVLKSYLGGKNHCWPSQKTIAREMKRSKRSVIRYIEELRRAKIVTSVRSNRNSVYVYTLQGVLSPRVSPRIVTSKAIHPNMNSKSYEQGRKPAVREETKNHHEPAERPAAEGFFKAPVLPCVIPEAPQKPAVTAQERALYARFQREYPFASPNQFASYKRDCEAVA